MNASSGISYENTSTAQRQLIYGNISSNIEFWKQEPQRIVGRGCNKHKSEHATTPHEFYTSVPLFLSDYLAWFTYKH